MGRAYSTYMLCRFASAFKAASLLLLAWIAIPGPLGALEPVFRFDDLLGTVTDGTRVRVVNGSSVTHMDVAEQVLLNGSLPEPGTLLIGPIGMAMLLTRRFRNQPPFS